MESNVDQCLVIIKTMIELSDSSAGSGLGQGRLPGGNPFEGHAMVFYERYTSIVPSHDNRYVTSHTRNVELRP